jgi:hypothetical protein
VRNEIANARRTLKSSYALLKLATTGPGGETVRAEARRHEVVPSGTQRRGSRVPGS